MTSQRQKDICAGLDKYMGITPTPNPTVFADGCAHVRAQWLEWARNFEKYHRACLDEEARGHLKQRIAKLEQP